MVGLERSVLPLIGEEDFGLALERGGPLLHRRLRRCQGAHQPRRRRARRAGRAQAAAGRRLARRAAGAAADRARAELGLDRRRQPLARRQPGPRLVDDGRDEDRPRRAASGAGSRSGSTRRPATAASPRPPSLSGWLAASFAPRTVVWVGAALIALHGPARSRARSCATPARTSRSSSATTAHGRRARRACAARSRTPPTATRRCAPARRPASSTTSTTRSPGASCRSSSPPTARALREIGARRRHLPGRLGRRPDRDRTGSDHIGRKPLIVAGMLVQAARSALLAAGGGAFAPALAAAVLLGAGTALVYPTLIAAVSDAGQPRDAPASSASTASGATWATCRRADRRDRRRRHLGRGGDRDRRRAHRRQRPVRRRDLLAAAAARSDSPPSPEMSKLKTIHAIARRPDGSRG